MKTKFLNLSVFPSFCGLVSENKSFVRAYKTPYTISVQNMSRCASVV